jgi:allantoate deiminase
MLALRNMTIRAEEVIARCRRLATFSEDRPGIRRTFLSAPMRACHVEISGWLKAGGAEVSVDAAGNLRGVYDGAKSGGPRLLVGSHLDTVPNAGAYDGVLGVVLGVALVEALEGRRLPFGIEVIGFSEEEGVRFGTPFIGSRALVGRVDEELLNRRDANGISVRAAIEQFELNPGEIRRAGLRDDTLGYLEFHIEQGPVLDALRKPLGVVEAIAGQTRMVFTFFGQPNHAGTTPMDLRRDALAGAAEWIVSVERIAHGAAELVATTGQIEARPGAVNVIAGLARVTLDLRHRSDAIRDQAAAAVVASAKEIAKRRDLSLEYQTTLDQKAVAMDALLAGEIEAAIRNAGCEPHRMTSGAGHDAMILAEKIPAAMVFLRTPGGISHDPAETVEVADVAKALECGMYLLEQLAGSPEIQKRIRRA